MVAHQRLEFVPNTDYWDKARVPKQDRLVLVPMPEASTRTAALLSGQVNWIEAPSPDAIDRLKSAGMQIVTNVYPHNWTYQLNFVKGPFTDKRVRQAANYALNRADMKELLNGLMLEGYATVPPSTPYYGHPVIYKYDPAKAKALLKEAGCLPCKVTFAISTSGSGQMQPLADERAGQVADGRRRVRGDARARWTGTRCCKLTREGVDKHPDVQRDQCQPADAGSVQRADPPCLDRRMGAEGRNWGHYSNPEIDKLIAASSASSTRRSASRC